MWEPCFLADLYIKIGPGQEAGKIGFARRGLELGKRSPALGTGRARLGQELSLPLWVGQPLQEVPRVPARTARRQATQGGSLNPVCPTNGDKDDRLEGVASRGLSTVPTNCKRPTPKLACLGYFFSPPLPPTSPPNSSIAETSAWLKPLPRRTLGLSRGVGLCVGKTLQESEGAGQRASERARAFASRQGTGRCALFPQLSLVLGRARCPELSRARQGVAGSGHIPEPSGATGSRREKPRRVAGHWSCPEVGGGEQRRGAKLSNCVRNPTRGGEREGRGGERRGGREPRGSERARCA